MIMDNNEILARDIFNEFRGSLLDKIFYDNNMYWILMSIATLLVIVFGIWYVRRTIK